MSARSSSLRAQLSSVTENALMIGGAGTVMAGAWGAVLLGPAGFALLALLPVDAAMVAMLRRRRLRERAVLVAKAKGPGRGTALVLDAADGDGARGGEPAKRVRARVEPAEGPAFDAEGEVFWAAAAPGAVGIAAWQDPGDVLFYFADGPETPEELEQALNRETGQYSREPVL